MTFGEKLTNLRRAQNYTQEQFANLLGVSRQAVSRWESGTAYPETDKLIRIGEMFDCSIDYLLKDSIEEPSPALLAESGSKSKKKLWVIAVAVIAVLALIIAVLVIVFYPRPATVTIRSSHGSSNGEEFVITYKEVASTVTRPTDYDISNIYGDWDLKQRGYDTPTFVVIDVKHLDKATVGSGVFVDSGFDRLYIRDNSTGMWRIFIAVSCTGNAPLGVKVQIDKRNGEFYRYYVG